MNIFSLWKVDEYHRTITILISMKVFSGYIIFVWSVKGAIKTKLMGTGLYDITKGNIMKIVMNKRIMGWFIVTQNGGLGCFWEFIPNNLFFLRQTIPSLLSHSWRTLLLLRGICFYHINRGVHVNGNYIVVIGKRFNVIDTPPVFGAQLTVLFEVVFIDLWIQEK